MRCFVRQIRNCYHAVFEWSGLSYTHSLSTKDKQEADVRLGPIRDTLDRLGQGTLQMPPGADAKAFILSSGQQATKTKNEGSLTIGRLSDFFAASRQVEPNTLETLTFHFNHFKRILKVERSLNSISSADIQGYADARSKEKHHGRQIQSRTIRKDLQTLRQAWTWAAETGLAKKVPTWRLKSLELDEDQGQGREPFRTFDQIEAKISRGGLSQAEQDRLWETLYLTSVDLTDLLAFIKHEGTKPFVFPMVAFVALTGCRRSEMVRTLIDDWDLENGRVMIREKKRDRRVSFTTREIDIHPTLAEIMADWFANHPGGQHAISQEGEPLTIDQATDHFKRTMARHKKWSKVRGFLTFRHSVASVRASKGPVQFSKEADPDPPLE